MKTAGFVREFRGYAACAAVVAAITGLVAVVREFADVQNVSMLYLLAVLAAAVAFGSREAIATSIASMLAYNFFFVDPLHHLTVSDDEEWVGLFLLLATGIATGQLTAALRQRAREAERREREAVVLYDVVRLMAEPELERALTAVAERLRTELALSAVTISFGRQGAVRVQADTGDPESIALAQNALMQSGRVLSTGAPPTGASRGQPGRWIKVMSPVPGLRRSDRLRRVPINYRGEEAGAIALVAQPGATTFAREEDRVLSVVAGQLGQTLERLNLQREANEAEALRRTDELRTALMNAVSHDLRTPLSSIIASAGSLLQNDVQWTDDDRREFLEAIDEEAQRLNRLVGNLLDLSRIEAGTIHPEKAWYDLGSLINEVAGRFRYLAVSHRLTIAVPDDLPPVEFDYVEIDQVLTNLIENAIKYTPAAAEIAVSAHVSDNTVRIEVADSGPGIPDDALPRLFEAFYRAPSRGPRPQGSGLGLAVARGLVEAHDGRIWAENRAEGGARFVFTLPLGDARPARTERTA